MTFADALRAVLERRASRAEVELVWARLVELAGWEAPKVQAEDLTQQLIAQWLARPPTLGDDETVEAYARTSLRNLNRSEWRKGKEGRTVKLDFTPATRPNQDEFEVQFDLQRALVVLEREVNGMVELARPGDREQLERIWTDLCALYLEESTTRDALIDRDSAEDGTADRGKLSQRLYTRHFRFRQRVAEHVERRRGAVPDEELQIVQTFLEQVFNHRVRGENRGSRGVHRP